MTFRGNASYFTQTNLAAVAEKDRADALKVAAKLREMKKALRGAGAGAVQPAARGPQAQSREPDAGGEARAQRLDRARRLPAAGLRLHAP
jgi:hypothetical protein